jgi:hypothetical protein
MTVFEVVLHVTEDEEDLARSVVTYMIDQSSAPEDYPIKLISIKELPDLAIEEERRRKLMDEGRKKYEGFRVPDYLGMTDEEFTALPPGVCRHPDCDRETRHAEALCRWHRGAYHRWYREKGGPT